MINLTAVKRRALLPHYWLSILSYFLMSRPALARDLESAAANLSSKTSNLAIILIPFGFAVSALFMLAGNPRGAQLMATTFMAGIITVASTGVVSWIKGVVG